MIVQPLLSTSTTWMVVSGFVPVIAFTSSIAFVSVTA